MEKKRFLLDEGHLFKYFDQEDAVMGTYAACLPLLAHNLDRYVNDLIIKSGFDYTQKFSLAEKIQLLRGNEIRVNRKTYQESPVISKELFGLLEDLRKERNSSVHVAGYLYQKIMLFTGIYIYIYINVTNILFLFLLTLRFFLLNERKIYNIF